MRWICFLFASATAAQGRPAKPLRFDLGLLPETRDSFTFFLDHEPRGFAVWQYETRSLDARQTVVYSSYSEFEPVEEERLRVVLYRRTGTADGKVLTVPVDAALPAGAVWFNYELYAAAVTNAAPGDSLAGPAYVEFEGSMTTLSFVADQPVALRVPAGAFDVLPLRSGNFRLYVTRQAPRRVVKGETLDGRFSFELAHTAPVVPTEP